LIKANNSAALITGAARRIGRHLALNLAQQGIAVAVHHNGSAEEAFGVVDDIIKAGGRACAIQADLSDTRQAQELLAHAAGALKAPINILINNASVFQKDTLETLTKDSWDLHHHVNLRAPILLIQDFAKSLPKNHIGCVINIIDQRVWKLNPQYMSYTASKAGLLAITKTTAQDLAHRHIRVNAIGPGPTLPNHRQAKEDFLKEASNTPLGKGPSLEEISACVRFLLETPSVTGQMIALDGGQHLAWRTIDIIED